MLKKFMVLVILLFSINSFALGEIPIEKGNSIIGGQFSVQHQSGDLYDDVTTVSINPSFGFFVGDGLMFGVNLELISMSGDVVYSEFRGGPKVGYYMNINKGREKIKGAVYPYIIAFMNFGQIDVGLGTDLGTMELGANIGAILMISDALGADLGLRYSTDSWSMRGYSLSGNTIQLRIGITTFLY